MQDYQNLPIDIQTSKLLDWLVDRRHCILKWQTSLVTIREKINAAIQDMPENEEIKQLLSGSYIHYFHCLRIIDILKGTEASSKNIFGRYSSQRMKDWQEIVSLYEKDNTYLAEVSSLLVRNVTYEVPSLKKQISKCQQAQQEFSRKELECQSGAADMRDKFYSSCKQYGITGDNIKWELLALVKDLPLILSDIVKETQGLSEIIELYAAFTSFVCEWSEEPVLPMLRYSQLKGNTTVYEWRTGSPPSVIDRPLIEGTPTNTVAEDTIDWGDLGSAGDAVTVGTDYGISLEEDGIDWGNTAEESIGGITLGDEKDSTVEIEVLDVGINSPEGLACGEDALTLLEYSQTRNQFIDELMELETFLSQRLTEMSEEGDVVSMSQFQLAPSVIQSQTRDKVLAMLVQVRSMIERLTTKKMQHLFMILASPRYVDRVTDILQQKMKQADILVLKQQRMVEKGQEALAEQAKLEPQLDQLIKRTRELQKQIEADISRRYNNRPVNLMGVAM
ncbi:CDK5 regulatory subunit-associated protein 3 [Polypterus senegalus]|uniref:CDK5 regulatory subunit-associated protein 3 n=1 Tax=Polypterus senegalus TaxID=55291 RepID=UPI001963262E|nr:CDK5 regulatory subunit-associated protein 3 [Polypterus senegalus]